MLFRKRSDCDRLGHWWDEPFVWACDTPEDLHFQRVNTYRVRRCLRCPAEDQLKIKTELEFAG